MRRKVILLSSVDFTHAYSGFQYLAENLHSRGYLVEIYAHVPLDHITELCRLPYQIHSCYEGLFGRIPKIRHLVFKKKIWNALRNQCDAVIVNASNPLGYFKLSVEFKRKNPTIPLIHYCPEVWVPGEARNFGKMQADYYLCNSNAPDIIIDVEQNRAEIRKKYLAINKPVYVIPNTLPLYSVTTKPPDGLLEKTAGCSIPKGKFVLLFTGVASRRTISELKLVFGNVSDRVFLLWFARGEVAHVKEANKELRSLLGESSVHVTQAVSRSTLLKVQHEADAGLVAYSFRKVKTVNQKYAAPTKIYEYLANGLPIISYPNPSVVELVDRFGLGVCSKLDVPESLGQAINEFFSREDLMDLSQHVARIFSEHLCYERCSEGILHRIYSLIDNSP